VALVAANLVTALEALWTEPTDSIVIEDTGDAIEAFWTPALVGTVGGPAIFSAGVTHPALKLLRTYPPTGAAPDTTTAAQAFDDACVAMITGTAFTPIAPATAVAVPIPLTQSPGALQPVLKAIFDAPSESVSAQASSIGNAIATFCLGWQCVVTFPTPTPPANVPIV